LKESRSSNRIATPKTKSENDHGRPWTLDTNESAMKGTHWFDGHSRRELIVSVLICLRAGMGTEAGLLLVRIELSKFCMPGAAFFHPNIYFPTQSPVQFDIQFFITIASV
jgi:hypothetical protein